MIDRKNKYIDITFQDGPVKENGRNGCQIDDVLEVLIERLQNFQAGEFRCRENAITITKLEEGLMWQQRRTMDRLSRGVEGYDKQ